MNICDRCIHADVCGEEGVFDEALTYCGGYIGWIPVSERLPKEKFWDDGLVEPSEMVLVYGDLGSYGLSRYWGHKRTKKVGDKDWMDLHWLGQKVVAWMPFLPKPYESQESEEE